MLYITLALAAGFLTFAGSGFPPIRNFGLLTGDHAGDRLRRQPDRAAGAAGDDQDHHPVGPARRQARRRTPTRTIPLLAGLRPAQARIVVLMGELRQFPPGATIVRERRAGQRDVRHRQRRPPRSGCGNGAERQQVAELRRGDVFGEMALVRQDERSADVEAPRTPSRPSPSTSASCSASSAATRASPRACSST